MSAVAQEALELREIRGPSAFGGGWTRFWRLTWLIGVTDFRLGYLGTFLGYLWSLMRPVMLFGVYYLVFTKIFRFGDQIKDYPALLLFNIMLFTFFADAAQRSVTSVVSNEAVVRKMQFPRIVIPFSIVLTAAFNMCLNLVAVLIFMLIYGVTPVWTWVFLPLLVVPLVIFTTAVSMILSVTFVRFRDVGPIWTVFSTALLYGSPVLYPLDPIVIPGDTLRTIMNFNPLAPLLEQAREWVIDPTAPGAVESVSHTGLLLVPLAIFVLTCVVALWLFNHEAPRIAEEL
jgi:ABC-2 type transport system permease protein